MSTTTDNVINLVAAARRLLEAREDQMLTPVEWQNLEAAVDAMQERLEPYYVAMLARYVVIDALNEDDARSNESAVNHWEGALAQNREFWPKRRTRAANAMQKCALPRSRPESERVAEFSNSSQLIRRTRDPTQNADHSRDRRFS